MKGKLIVVEGTDCSGKETQSNLLEETLNKLGKKTKKLYFPNYATPTGRIVGTCYLGKEELCNKYLKTKTGWFDEGASKVDGLVSSLYYAADRKYNIEEINKLLKKGINVILDRYTYSNMAHQGCKIKNQKDRFIFFKKIDCLEFELLELPRPDIVLFLYVPYEISYELKKYRKETMDQHEKDEEYLKKAEKTYLELAKIYDFLIIKCTNDNKIKTKEEINKNILDKLIKIV